DIFTLSQHDALPIWELAFLTQINLRADPRNPELRKSFSDALGFSLPLTPNTTASQGDRRALWLGPDEWLIVGPPDQQAPLEQARSEEHTSELQSQSK